MVTTCHVKDSYPIINKYFHNPLFPFACSPRLAPRGFLFFKTMERLISLHSTKRIVRKIAYQLIRYPVWRLKIIMDDEWSIIDELKMFDVELSNKEMPNGERGINTLPKAYEYGTERSSSFLDNPNLRSMLAVAYLALLALRQTQLYWVDIFVSLFVTICGCLFVLRFVFAVTEILFFVRFRGDCTNVVQIAETIFNISVVLLSSAPFIMPWILGYYFPYEILWFLLVFDAINILIDKAFNNSNTIVKQPQYRGEHSRKALQNIHKQSNAFNSLGNEGNHADAMKRKDRKFSPTIWQLELRAYMLSPSGHEWLAAFFAIQSIHILFATIITMIWEHILMIQNIQVGPMGWWDLLRESTLGAFSTSLFFQTFWLQYAVCGQRMHFDKGWKFFQPFQGGWRFVLLQTLAWTLYKLCMLLLFLRLSPLIVEGLGCISPDNCENFPYPIQKISFLVTFFVLDKLPFGVVGTLFIVADVLVIASLFFYQDEKTGGNNINGITCANESEVRTLQSAKHGNVRIFTDMLRTVFISMSLCLVFLPQICMSLLSFTVCSCIDDSTMSFIVLLVVMGMYLQTYAGEPSLSGRRMKSGLGFIGNIVVELICDHFDFQIIRKGPMWKADEKYICCYGPHSAFPACSSYAKNTEAWQKLFPDIVSVTLTASITHLLPILRDFNQWSGSLEVSRRGFWKGLDNFPCVIILPGGQHEMLLRSDDKNELVSTIHKGFIKLALQRAARKQDKKLHLVPCFCFGERKILRNHANIPMGLQKWLIQRLRTNLAVFLVGRWGLPFVVDQAPITLVVGDPIPVPVISGRSRSPTQNQVDLLHSFFYSRVKQLFDEFKVIHRNGYETMEIVFGPNIKTISEEEWNFSWKAVASDSSRYEEKADVHFMRQVEGFKPDIKFAELAFSVFFSFFCYFMPWYTMKT